MSEELPTGWTTCFLGDVADISDSEREPVNSSMRKVRIEGKPSNELYPYFGATGQVGWIDSFRSEGEAILLGEDGAPFLDSSKDKAFLVQGQYWVNNHAHILRGANALINNRFLCYQLNITDYHPFVSGSTRLKLTNAAMKQIPLVIASTNEQTRIVAKLEELLSDLDAAVAELKAAQKKLAQYRQALLKAAVEGTLTAAWRAAQTAPQETGAQLLTHILIERRQRWQQKQLAKFKAQGKTPPQDWQDKYPEPQPPDTTDLPDLPEGWTWASLDQVFVVERGRFSVRPRNDPRYYGGSIPFVQIGDLPREGGAIHNYHQTLNDAGLGVSKMFPLGTVLIAIVGATIGNTGILSFDSCCPDSLVALQSSSPVLLKFVELFLRTLKYSLRSVASASGGQPNINLELLQPLAFPLPPLSEIEAIVNFAEKQLSVAEHIAMEIETKMKTAHALRQVVLRSAFCGQLVAQDPHDEPASVLLERIRAARATQSKPRKGGGKKE